MTDSIYLDGSQPYHRHQDSDTVNGGDPENCGAGPLAQALPVRVFDPDALTAHDDAIRQQAEQGLPDAPLYVAADWEWAILAPPEPGQDVAECRVQAGWTKGGEFRRYVSAEALVRAFREHIKVQS